MIGTLVLATLIAPAWGAERVAVLELQGDSLQAEHRTLLTDTIRGAVRSTLGDAVQVMTRENMEVMLTDMGTPGRAKGLLSRVLQHH